MNDPTPAGPELSGWTRVPGASAAWTNMDGVTVHADTYAPTWTVDYPDGTHASAYSLSAALVTAARYAPRADHMTAARWYPPTASTP